jgi:hypothetical protein
VGKRGEGEGERNYLVSFKLSNLSVCLAYAGHEEESLGGKSGVLCSEYCSDE